MNGCMLSVAVLPMCHETMDVAQIYVFGRLRRIPLGTEKQKWSMTTFLTDVSVPRGKQRQLSMDESLVLYNPPWTKGEKEEDKISKLHVLMVSSLLPPTQQEVEQAEADLKRRR